MGHSTGRGQKGPEGGCVQGVKIRSPQCWSWAKLHRCREGGGPRTVPRAWLCCGRWAAGVSLAVTITASLVRHREACGFLSLRQWEGGD